MSLPFSQASENNKNAILAILKSVFAPSRQVLEIGSGTGQHACFFASQLPFLQWQPSNLLLEGSGLAERTSQAALANVYKPIALDVSQEAWPTGFDAVFSANTAHIMAWPLVLLMIQRVGEVLPFDGMFALYGPFKYEGSYTSESNAEFDLWLKERGETQGIRDVESVCELATQAGLCLVRDHAMPANNQMLVFKKMPARKS